MRELAKHETDRVDAPDATEIQRRFRSPAVRVTRPIILAGVRVLGMIRRFGWSSEGLTDAHVDDPPLIFAANHASHADTAAILGTLPAATRRRTCVAAALDVFGPASNGNERSFRAFRQECLQITVAAGFHAFAFDRHGPPRRSLRTAIDLVSDGWSLLLYPEGTRSRTGALGPFKSGIGVMAKLTGRPVVPVHVSGGTDILPCRAFLPCRGHATVRYGEPIRLERDESARAFTERLRHRIRELDPTTVDATIEGFGAATVTAAKCGAAADRELATVGGEVTDACRKSA